MLLDDLLRYSIVLMHKWSWALLFFFSSRRRHTRSKRDWSSDVCSSDLGPSCNAGSRAHPAGVWRSRAAHIGRPERSEERRVGKSVDLGGRRIIKKKKKRKLKKTKTNKKTLSIYIKANHKVIIDDIYIRY